MLEVVIPGDPHVRRVSRALDVPTALAIAAGGAGLVAAIVFMRFCSAISMPAKPPPPRFDERPEQVAARLNASSDVYLQAVARDARKAGIPTPSEAELTRAFTFQSDTKRRTLRPGDSPIEAAGLRIRAISHRVEGSEPLLSLVIENPSTTPLAYVIDTEVSSGNAPCVNRTLLPHNGNVIAAGGKEVRSECSFKRGMELYLERVETAAITPMAAYYLSLVPPQAIGAGDRVGKGHRPQLPAGVTTCNVAMSQSVMAAIEDGQTHWRDLADFYGRHSCMSYQFPDGYRAFEKDGERALPVVSE
jgi:hypothetical protein